MTHQLTPTTILENLAQGCLGGNLETVVLLVDISGFTILTNRLMVYGAEGAEVLAAVLTEIFQPLLQIVYSQGGFVATFGGDAFKAIFPIQPAPVSDEVYARAIVAAEQIRQQIFMLGEQTTRFGVFHFAGKVCLASGMVEWGVWQGTPPAAGAGQRAAYYFEGAAIDACMALEAHSVAGDVLLTETVFARLPRTALRIEPVAAHWRLLGLTETFADDLSPRALPLPVASHDRAAYFFPTPLLQMKTQGEFRRVVTLFVNLESAPQSLDGRFQHTFFRLLAQYGGYLCRVSRSGGGQSGITLLLFWGAPVSHENDVERALSFVQALQTASPVSLRAGVTTGLAYAGFVGSALREEYTCYGSHVNLAVRQMTRAAWGEIWLDGETARQAQAAFAVTHHSQVAFKGFAAPQPVFLLGARHSSIAAFYQGELIGRQAELAQLRTAIQPILTGHFAGVILITGEAGMGKSRLVHEVQRRLENVERGEEGETRRQEDRETIQNQKSKIKNPQWFLCQTDEILRQSLNPFRYWLRSYFRQSPTQGEAVNKQAFTAKLDELIADLDAARLAEDKQSKIAPSGPPLKSEIERTRSFLGALVDLYWPDSLYAQVEPQLRFENTLIALKTLIQVESLRRPVILHLEDGHWLDADSRTFLIRLTRAVEEYPFAVLITTRPPSQEGREPMALLPPDVPQVTIELNPLAAADLTQLAMERLGGPLAPELATLLNVRAEGNPFFAEQVLLYLQEQGVLANAETGWRLHAGADQTGALPTDARALLVARLDRLTSTVKEVVQTAAVLGREFAVQVLSQMLGHQRDLDERLQDAERAAIWSALSELRYLFKHALLRDAAYEMQLRARLRDLHQLAAETLQALYAADLDPYVAEIAYHYERAWRQGLGDLQSQALYYLERAAKIATRNYQNEMAIDHFNRALQGTPETALADQYRLMLARSKLYQLQGERERQRQDLTAGAALANRLDNQSFEIEATLEWSHYALAIGDYPQAETAAHKALTLARQHGLPKLELQSLANIGIVAYLYAKQREAIPLFLEALQLARDLGDHRFESWLLDYLGMATFNDGDLPAARQYHLQAAQLAQAHVLQQRSGYALQHLGLVLGNQNEHSQARQSIEQALTIFRQIGDRPGISQAIFFLGNNDAEQGHYHTAQRYLSEALQMSRQLDDKRSIAMIFNNLGYVAFAQGDFTQAYTYYTQSIEQSRNIRYRWCEGRGLFNLGLLYHYQGDPSKAITTLEESLDIARESGIHSIEASALTGLGHALRSVGRFPEANDAYQAALARRRTLGQPNRILEPLAGLAAVALATHALPTAQILLEEILRQLQTSNLHGMYEPFWVYWVCYQILQTIHDPRTTEVLLTAHERLQQRAANIDDPTLHHSYLQVMPAHRAIVEEFARLHPAGMTAPAPS